jgi:hypothetical protein
LKSGTRPEKGGVEIGGFKVNLETTVNNDVIRGGICIYIMLGMLWFLFYQIILAFSLSSSSSFPSKITINKKNKKKTRGNESFHAYHYVLVFVLSNNNNNIIFLFS